jgi:hypothetical protein
LKDADSCETEVEVEVYNAMIRFFFKENPEGLSDMEFAVRVKELCFLAEEGFLRGVKKQ